MLSKKKSYVEEFGIVEDLYSVKSKECSVKIFLYREKFIACSVENTSC